MDTLDSKWVSYRSACYLRGKGVVFGCGPNTPFPHEAKIPGVYPIVVDPVPHPLISVVEKDDFSVIANESLDFVFHGINWGPPTLYKLVPKLKPGGHVIVHIFAKKKDVYFAALQSLGHMQLKINMYRDNQGLIIAKYLGNKKCKLEDIKPVTGKRACISRFGAIGDMIMVTPLIRALSNKGYEVTVNTTPYSAPVLDHDQYVSNVVVQERNIVPNNELGPYWDEWAQDYDVYINLSESIEGDLLKIENRKDFYTTKQARHDALNVNYIDRTLELGGCEDETNRTCSVIVTPKEYRDAEELLRGYGVKSKDYIIMWGLNGTSYHKVYHATPIVAEQFLQKHPDAHIFLLGNETARPFVFGGERVHSLVGKINIRQMFALIKWADCVIGPESAAVNVAGCFDNHKIVFLSHSSKENLTKYWSNTIALEPDTSIAPCYPCHQLHYSLGSCPLIEINGSAQTPVCTIAIDPPDVLNALESVYCERKNLLVTAPIIE